MRLVRCKHCRATRLRSLAIGHPRDWPIEEHQRRRRPRREPAEDHRRAHRARTGGRGAHTRRRPRTGFSQPSSGRCTGPHQRPFRQPARTTARRIIWDGHRRRHRHPGEGACRWRDQLRRPRISTSPAAPWCSTTARHQQQFPHLSRIDAKVGDLGEAGRHHQRGRRHRSRDRAAPALGHELVRCAHRPAAWCL